MMVMLAISTKARMETYLVQGSFFVGINLPSGSGTNRLFYIFSITSLVLATSLGGLTAYVIGFGYLTRWSNSNIILRLGIIIPK